MYNSNKLDKNGYNERTGFNEQGFHRDTGTQYNLEGFNRLGYDRDGLNKNGFDMRGLYVNEKREKSRYDHMGYNSMGRNKLGYDRNGLKENGVYDKEYDMKLKPEAQKLEKELNYKRKLKNLYKTKEALEEKYKEIEIEIKENPKYQQYYLGELRRIHGNIQMLENKINEYNSKLEELTDKQKEENEQEEDLER